MSTITKEETPPWRGILQQNTPLAPYTTWRVGGPADMFYQPKDLADLIVFLKQPRETKPAITWLGGGSKVLIRDGGIRGLVIHTNQNLKKIGLLSESTVRAEAGVTCAKLINFCLKNNLVDALFLSGIPGTVGGTLFMNAGIGNESIWQHVVAVETINDKGEINLRIASEFQPAYRVGGKLNTNEWFVAAHLKFTVGDAREAQEKMRKIIAERHKKQPWKENSCGSVFKNPPEAFAAQLIEKCGLKGKTCGTAFVSPKHANFIINPGDATAAQIEELINLVRAEVYKQTGINLELEVQILGVPPSRE